MKDKRYRKYIGCAALVIMLLIAVFITIINITNNEDKCAEISYRTYTVQQGDNLTKIANRFYKDTYLNEAIFEIKQENNLKSSNLEVGQVLRLKVE